jgi:hypothetical protein
MSVEYGDSDSKSPFPASWGRPPAGAYSEERALWVKRKVREHIAGQPLQQLRQRQIQMLQQIRMAQVERLRREAP